MQGISWGGRVVASERRHYLLVERERDCEWGFEGPVDGQEAVQPLGVDRLTGKKGCIRVAWPFGSGVFWWGFFVRVFLGVFASSPPVQLSRVMEAACRGGVAALILMRECRNEGSRWAVSTHM